MFAIEVPPPVSGPAVRTMYTFGFSTEKRGAEREAKAASK
jgi:hypothetical protein